MKDVRDGCKRKGVHVKWFCFAWLSLSLSLSLSVSLSLLLDEWSGGGNGNGFEKEDDEGIVGWSKTHCPQLLSLTSRLTKPHAILYYSVVYGEHLSLPTLARTHPNDWSSAPEQRRRCFDQAKHYCCRVNNLLTYQLLRNIVLGSTISEARRRLNDILSLFVSFVSLFLSRRELSICLETLVFTENTEETTFH